MYKINKYKLNTNDSMQELRMPQGANIVHVGFQIEMVDDSPCLYLWAWIDTAIEKEEVRTFKVIRSEQGVEQFNFNYVGTAQAPNLDLVCHVLEFWQVD